MAWSGLGKTHLVRKQAGEQESSGPVSGRTQPAPLPVSHFQTRFHSSTDVLDNTVQNQPGSGLVLVDCVRFWAKQIRSGSKAGEQESSGLLLANASQPIRTGCELDPACLLGICNSTASVYWFGKTGKK